MIAAEIYRKGEKNVEITWAYPSAFTDHAHIKMKNFWKQIVDLFNKEIRGIAFTVIPEGVTESISVCRYARAEGKTFPGGISPTIIIDVGGGSTDIGIWKSGKILLQTSLKIGANDVITEFSRNYEDFKNDIYPLYNKIDLNKLKEKSIDEDALLNCVLHQCSEEILTNIHAGGLGKTWKEEFYRMIHLYFAGVFFYTGRLLSRFGEIIDSQDEARCHVYVYIVGKGSNLLKWISTGSEYYASILPRFITLNDAMYHMDIQVEITDAPKEEVGRGLLSRAFTDESKVVPKTIVGENLTDKSIDAYDLIDSHKAIAELDFSACRIDYNDNWVKTFINTINNVNVSNLFAMAPMENPADLQSKITQYSGEIGVKYGNQSLFALELKVILKEALKRKENA